MCDPLNFSNADALLVFRLGLELVLEDFKLLDGIIDFAIKMGKAFALFARHCFEFVQSFFNDIKHSQSSFMRLGTDTHRVGLARNDHSTKHVPVRVAIQRYRSNLRKHFVFARVIVFEGASRYGFNGSGGGLFQTFFQNLKAFRR